MLNRILAIVIALLALGTALPGTSHAQPAATNWNPGLAVGAQAPAFKLVGQDGQEHALADLLIKGKLVLVFQRSADW
jgi:cytochrome oxidase Cu insertion factor (SCO1/SenC/PrrC family)